MRMKMGMRAALLALGLVACAVDGAERDDAVTSTEIAPETRPQRLRVGNQHWLRRARDEEQFLNPLVYSNHLPKSFAFETLLRTDGRGRILPGLATSWEVSPDRRTWTFHLRPNARFHDGSRCDAEAVARYFRSWLVGDEDRFIGACERIESVRAIAPRTVEFRLTEAYPLDLDLPLTNPMAIVGHGMGRSPAGLVALNGSGPWRLVDHAWMTSARYERFDEYDGAKPVLDAFDYVVLPAGSDRDPIGVWALDRDRIDVLVESWRPSIDRDAARRLVARGGFEILEAPGSMVQILCFQSERAPFSHLAWRARVLGAVDRTAIVEAVEQGFADPVETLFDPKLDDWPDAPVSRVADPGPANGRVRATLLVLESDSSQMRLGVELMRQLSPAGIDLDLAVVSAKERTDRIERGEYDMYVHRTWGAPYDPHATLYDRIGLRAPVRAAQAGGLAAQFHEDAELQRLVESSWRAPTVAARRESYRAIQAWIDEHAALVPLYVPRRIAVVRAGVRGLVIGEDPYRIDFSALDWAGASIRR